MHNGTISSTHINPDFLLGTLAFMVLQKIHRKSIYFYYEYIPSVSFWQKINKSKLIRYFIVIN